MMEQTIIIADDHAIVRDGLTNIINKKQNYKIIASVDSAESLLLQCQKQLPDIVITDLSMPGMGGIEGIRRLKLKWPKLKIVVFSISQNHYLVKKILEIGSSAYISKSSTTDVLLKALNFVSVGKQFVSPDIDFTLTNTGSSTIKQLSSRELDIFCTIIEGKTTKQVADKLFLSEKTIANNISIIKKKLQVKTFSELVQIAIASGILATN